MVAGAEPAVNGEADADQAETGSHEKTVRLIRFEVRDRGLHADPDPGKQVNATFGMPMSISSISLDEYR